MAPDQVITRESGEAPDVWNPYVKLPVLAALLLACYFPMLVWTGRTILSGDDMAYGLFAPIVALYLAWGRREALLHPEGPPSLWSLPVLLFAAALGVSATLAQTSTFSRFAFLISLAGCLLLAGGRPALRRFRFPLCLLLFTFPIPEVLYGQVTQPLRLLATRVSEFLFELLGFSVVRDGNILQLTHMTLSVAEVCSGLRSLITLTFFCLIYSYFFEKNAWMRACVTLLAIPAAILANVLRITTTGVLGKYNIAWTIGAYHEVVGWTAASVAFGLVFLAHRMIGRFLRPPAPGDAQ